jgi:hypothetical protein
VIVDYGHNAAALDATGRMISSVWGGEPVAAITLPGDRRDDLTAQSAEAIAAWFGRVVIYEDADKRGRRPGEMTELITAAMRGARPGITLAAAGGPHAALRTAVEMAAGHPVLFLYEKLAMAHEALASLNARPRPADAVAPAPADTVPAAVPAGTGPVTPAAGTGPVTPAADNLIAAAFAVTGAGSTAPTGARAAAPAGTDVAAGTTCRRQPPAASLRRRSRGRDRRHRLGLNRVDRSRASQTCWHRSDRWHACRR